MSSNRFFVINEKPPEGGRVVLDPAESRHLSKVLRSRTGDEVILLDGSGGVYTAVVDRAGGEGAVLRIKDYSLADRPVRTDMALALTRAAKMDSAVEKCAEIGISRIVPFTCRRTIWKSTGAPDAEKKRERLERKVIAACKQSGNPWFTEIECPVDFEGIVELFTGYERIYYADIDGDPAGSVMEDRPVGSVLGIIGPEGGFDPDELGMLIESGAIPVNLGKYRLRSETAAACLAWWLLRAVGRC
jgi:16S rRNA (uracil1498-N3)-methyltransferase